MAKPEIVWLLDERTFGLLINMGAHFSTVSYQRGVIEYEVLVSNDEFEFRGEDDASDDED